MANVKITDLTNLTDPSTADVMPVVDVDADVTKKVSVGEVIGKISGDVDVATDGTSSIAAGVIVDADINDSAEIADTKLATIATAGKVSNSATTATDANTASAIVARDASGNFSAGTITAALTGNSDTATALSSARTFAVTGDVTGTVNSDLTSGVSITTSIASGAIVDADINAAAAIAGTKIDPDFGSQTVETTGVFSAAGGAEAAPSITFTGDLSTGLYQPGEYQVAISTNGVQRINFEADGDINIDSGGVFYDATNGRLGAGTTVPREILHAHASPDARLKLTDDSTGNGASDGFEVTSQGSLVQREATGIKFFVNNGSSTDERARIDSSGRVLVGLSTLASGGDASAEAARLVVQGRVGNDNDSGRINIQRGSVPSSAGIDIGNIYFTDSSNNIYASILAECDGTTGAGDYPGRLAFSVTADGASSPTEALGISNDRSIAVSDGGNVVFGTTTGTKIGTATSQKIGFYNATPVIQPNAVADITTTATSGSLPTPDGSVTIADATTPTATELLEYCVELEAKLEAALGRLRALGLIAS